jgi:hypothetical protein
MVRSVRLGEQLVADGVITGDLLAAALERQSATRERIGSALIALGADADAVARALAGQKGVVAVHDAELAAIAPALKKLVPDELVRRLWAVPVRVAPAGELVVAMRNPDDRGALADLERAIGGPVRAAAAAELRLRQAIANALPAPTRAPLPTAVPQPSPPMPPLRVPARGTAPPAPLRAPLPGAKPAATSFELPLAQRIGSWIGIAIGSLAAIALVAGAVVAWRWLREPAFPRSLLPIESLVGMRIPALDDDWRGPAKLGTDRETARTELKAGRQPARGAVYGRDRDRNTVRDLLILSHEPGPRRRNEEPEVVLFESMTVGAVTCTPSRRRSDVDTIDCDATGIWQDRTIQVHMVSWIDGRGDRRSVVGITCGDRDDIVDDTNAAAARAQVY